MAAPGRTVVGIGIATSALADGTGEPALRRAVHEELIEDLSIHGTLVFTSQVHLEMFAQAVGRLPTSLAKAWEIVLSSGRVSVRVHDPQIGDELSDVLDPAALDSSLAPDVQLVLVDGDHAELLGVADDEFSARSPGGLVEIGRITTAGRTTTLLGARQALDAPLREGVSREQEWAVRFGPLSRTSRPIVIYDKFVGPQIVRRYVYDSETGDGLTWLLTRIGAEAERRVRVITSVTDVPERGRLYDERNSALAFRRMMQPLRERRLRLDLVLVPERTRSQNGRAMVRFGHDRHIRFGERAALALGAGMQVFSTSNFRETTTVARLPITDAKAREEQAIKCALRPPEGGWLSGGV